MSTGLHIYIKPITEELPKGAIRVKDLVEIANSLEDAMSRLIQQDMGYSPETKLLKQSKDFGSLIVTDLTKGSCGIQAMPESLLKPEGSSARAATRALETLNKAFAYQAQEERWPKWLPETSRHKLGLAFRELSKNEALLEVTIALSNAESKTYQLTKPRVTTLEKQSDNQIEDRVQIIGIVTNINMNAQTFRVSVNGRIHRIESDRDFIMKYVDPIHWGKIMFYAYRKPGEQTLHKPHEATKAEPNTEEEMIVLSAIDELENTDAFKYVHQRIERFRGFEKNWDSYNSNKPSPDKLNSAMDFFRGVCRSFLAFDMVPVVPFAVPTPEGHIQFEWTTPKGELELEVLGDNHFLYLHSPVDGEETEGECDRWQAMYFIRSLSKGDGYI